MSDIGSISVLLQNLKDGEESALAALHGRCWTWMVQSAKSRLRGQTLRSVDEEDVAQEALWGFVKSVREGRVPQLETRHHLFALLTHIVACKAATQVERHLAVKRGAGQVRGESALDDGSGASHFARLELVSGKERTPFEEATLADCYRHYISRIPEDVLRLVAELHLAGATNAEIAAQLGVVDRTVERKLAILRSRWQEMAADELGTR